ncbi:MAG: hypothetical protein CL946_00320, partial [Ectothiorhodospiraceae bacterium]|nr:hypothetical protein [Ectothiorhodospiraceae bacterium]
EICPPVKSAPPPTLQEKLELEKEEEFKKEKAATERDRLKGEGVESTKNLGMKARFASFRSYEAPAPVLLSVVVGCLLVGYFAGREHLKYEVRQMWSHSMTEASQVVERSFELSRQSLSDIYGRR